MQQQMSLYRTTKSFQQNHKTSELKCQNCEQAFLANRKTAKFCSSSCRSQFWMTKNQKKVITIAVPIDIDDAYLEKIKLMLENYKPVGNAVEKSPIRSHQNETFETEKDLRTFMAQAGYSDYKIPKHDMGIYYDEGMTIKKIEAGFQVKIMA
jgi:hypothetical protein|tara:strand:+ start:932 stop:1387 length:456 start_codon:yes stop_codon:yes gene_type:complete